VAKSFKSQQLIFFYIYNYVVENTYLQLYVNKNIKFNSNRKSKNTNYIITKKNRWN